MIIREKGLRVIYLLEAITRSCIRAGEADNAYIYARILARFYFRELSNRAWYDAMRGYYTPNRPAMWKLGE
jgi:hypothetical protein